MNRFLSQKFRFYSFISIAFLLFVHGYNLQLTYLTPYSTVSEPLTFTSFIEYFLSNGLLRFRIPMLFMISGYIFALQDKKSYSERLKKRFFSLIIPFFIWSAVNLLITYLWQQFPLTAQAVKNAGLGYMGDNRPYNEMSWKELLYLWAVRPVSFQLWFIRSLFIYNAFYPVLKWLVKRLPLIWFAVIFIFWHSIYSFGFIEGQGLFFFSAGIWLYKTNYPIHKSPSWFSRYLCWLFFVGLSIIKTFMAFEFEPDSQLSNVVIYFLYDISIFSGILAIWFTGDDVVKWLMDKKWFSWVTSFSFIIFAMHAPLLHYTTNLFFIFFKNVQAYRLLTYFLVPVIIFFICLGAGVILRNFLPKVYKVATGGRGF